MLLKMAMCLTGVIESHALVFDLNGHIDNFAGTKHLLLHYMSFLTKPQTQSDDI